MDDPDDPVAQYLSRFAGILEELSAVAVEAKTARNEDVIARMQERLEEAAALLDAAAALAVGQDG